MNSDNPALGNDPAGPVDDSSSELSAAYTIGSTMTTGKEPMSFGRYQVRGVRGTGGFGTVYAGYDAHLQREVAIKVPFATVRARGCRRLPARGAQPGQAQSSRHPDRLRRRRGGRTVLHRLGPARRRAAPRVDEGQGGALAPDGGNRRRRRRCPGPCARARGGPSRRQARQHHPHAAIADRCWSTSGWRSPVRRSPPISACASAPRRTCRPSRWRARPIASTGAPTSTVSA